MTLARTATPWSAADMPDLQGKVILITGANSGIGFATAKQLAAKRAHVVLACRSVTRGEHALAMLQQELPDAQLSLLQVDMGNLASIRDLADTFQRQFKRLDVLINNAGVMYPPEPRTADGFESHFGVNHLGHFYFTSLLFDLLRRSAPARIVTVSSLGHRMARLDLANLRAQRVTNAWFFHDYNESKLANLLFAYELQRRIDAAGIHGVLSVACHPGVALTNIAPAVVNKWFPACLQSALAVLVPRLPLFQSADRGALPTLYAATHPLIKGAQFVGPSGWLGWCGHPVLEQSSAASHSMAHAQELWQLSEQLLDRTFELE